jgi:hypothetical protein
MTPHLGLGMSFTYAGFSNSSITLYMQYLNVVLELFFVGSTSHPFVSLLFSPA